MVEKSIIDTFLRTFDQQYEVYPFSIKKKNECYFFMIKDKQRKYLVTAGCPKKVQELNFNTQEGKKIKNGDQELLFKICPLTHDHLIQLRLILDYLKPVCSNKFSLPSFGTGDRLGIATPAHIQAFQGKNIFPVLAQLSTREITRTESSLERVMDNAIWGCFEMGFEGPFGSDADHIKDFDNLQKAINCGFTLYTIDPSDYIDNNIAKYSKEERRRKYQELPDRREIEQRYLEKEFQIDGKKLYFDQDNLAEIALTYGQAIKYVVKCYQFLKEKNKKDFELEVSIDETPNPTSPLAHLWIASELQYQGVNFQNLAPHYLGDWEKGIEYIGDIEAFEEELKLHYQIASFLGGYKLSLHSGSDKFSVYPIFAREAGHLFHIKTAGTSWLEAVKVIALTQPELYREIHNFALTCFSRDRFSYHLSTDLEKIPDVNRMKDEELVSLFTNNNARQLIHITYGSILREKDKEGGYRFRDRIYKTLFDQEKTHYQVVANHIKHHLDLLS